jgi:hypothetical protein
VALVKRTSRRAIPTLLASFLIGCQGDTRPESTTTPGDTIRPAEVTAVPTPTARPWQLEIDGIGPGRVGMTVAAAEQLLGAAKVERIEDGDVCGYANFARLPEGVSFMVAGDTLVRVNVDAEGVRTAEGLGVGSTEEQVKAAFGARVSVEPHPYTGPEGHYLIVTDPRRPDFRMIFETDGKVVTSFRAGREPEVHLIEGCA